MISALLVTGSKQPKNDQVSLEVLLQLILKGPFEGFFKAEPRGMRIALKAQSRLKRCSGKVSRTLLMAQGQPPSTSTSQGRKFFFSTA